MTEAGQHKGSILGGVLLVTGSCIGAGMLALPIVTGDAGFFPALFMFLVAWAFMTVSAFLLLEIYGWFRSQVNIVSMVEYSLGQFGRSLSWILYLFLFYSLAVAYIAGSGNVSAAILGGGVPAQLTSTVYVVVFGIVVYLGTRHVDIWNRVLMFGKAFAFLAVVFLAATNVQPAMLLRAEPQQAIFALPVLVIAFGFQNVIPSITHYLQGDLRRVRTVIWAGSLSALGIYVIWELMILGILPLGGVWGIKTSLREGRDAAQALAGFLGISWIGGFAQALAFFAMLTSFLAQTLGLVHFIADGLRLRSTPSRREPLGICALALVPPLLCALVYPQLFLKALGFAGGVCANILFGFLPAVVVWMGRSRHARLGEKHRFRVPGGNVVLVIVIAVALVILCLQVANMLHVWTERR